MQTGFKPVKTDALGRAQFSREDREMILDAFEVSHLSGAAFARQCGVNYQTFANWVQKRRRQRGEYRAQADSDESGGGSGASGFVELELSKPAERSGEGARIELPGGARMKITSSADVKLLAALLLALEGSRPC